MSNVELKHGCHNESNFAKQCEKLVFDFGKNAQWAIILITNIVNIC
jgi:hypothetical protein